jgi:hypothetical protein
MRATALLLFALTALALSACGEPPTWHKEGIDEMTVQRDLSACRKQAQAMQGPPGVAMGSSPMGPRFGPVDASPADRAMQEGQAINGCMRGKGYTLKAADKK